MSDPEKPPITKVTLLPDQPLTPQQKQACVAYLTTYEPKIYWEVGQKVIAYLGTKIINLYIREIDPRTRFFGHLPEDGEIHIVPHKEIGETPTQKQPREVPVVKKPVGESTGDPILTIHRVPPGTEIQITIKREK